MSDVITGDHALPAKPELPEKDTKRIDAPADTGAPEEKKFSQAEMDAVIRERLARQQRTFEAQQREAQQALEAKQLEEQAEWQKLANRRAEEIRELKPRAGLADSYEKAIRALLEVQTREQPSHIQTLLDKLSLVDQIDWLVTNAPAMRPAPAVASASADINAWTRQKGSAPTEMTDEEYRAKKRREMTLH